MPLVYKKKPDNKPDNPNKPDKKPDIPPEPGRGRMAINIGYKGGSLTDPDDPEGVLGQWRVYYDETVLPVGDTQPIINKRIDPATGDVVPSGGTNAAFWAITGDRLRVEVWRPDLGPVEDDANWQIVKAPKAGAFTATANQLSQWGITTRGQAQLRGPLRED